MNHSLTAAVALAGALGMAGIAHAQTNTSPVISEPTVAPSTTWPGVTGPAGTPTMSEPGASSPSDTQGSGASRP